MTTIAYRDGVLAGDGRETCQNDEHSSWYKITDSCVKVFKLKDGRLFGAAHGSEDCERLHRSLVDKTPPPKLEDVEGIMIDLRGRIWRYEGNIWVHVKTKYYSTGSGSIHAMTAMDCGATAIEAVKAGIKRDLWSGGKVTAVRLRK